MSTDSSSDSVGSLPIFQCVGLQKVEPEKLAYIFVNYDGTEERWTGCSGKRSHPMRPASSAFLSGTMETRSDSY